MSSTCFSTIEGHGNLYLPRSNRPFSIGDEKLVWIVKSGSLDLFFVSGLVENGVGPRYPIARIASGNAVFGLAFDSDAQLNLVACATPGTELLVMTQSKLFEKMAAGGGNRELIRLLDDWIHQSYMLVAGNQKCSCAPQKLELDQMFIAPDELVPVAPNTGVVWVSHRKGRSRFMNSNVFVPIDGDLNRVFPVSRYGWLEPITGSVLCATDSEAILQSDSALLQAFRDFHRVVMSHLIADHQRKEKDEQFRLRDKAAKETAVAREALRQLTGPLVPGADDSKLHQEIDDPLFRACREIGDWLGVEIRTHAHMLFNQGMSDLVASIAKASNLRVRRVVLWSNWRKLDAGPLLAFRQADNRPVALLPASPTSYRLFDPVERQSCPVDEALCTTLDATAYMFYRSFPDKRLSTFDVFMFGIRGCKREIMTILIAGVAAGVLGIVTPFATGIVFDNLIPGAERGQLIQLGIYLFGCAICASIFVLVRGFAILRLQGKTDAALQSAVWDRLLRLPVPFFRNYTSGDLAARSLGISKIRQALTGSVIGSFLGGIFSVFSFALLFFYSWRLALLAAVLVCFAFVFSTGCGYLRLRYERKMVEISGSISGKLLQIISAMAKLRVAGAENRAFAEWSRQFARQMYMSRDAQRVSNALVVFNSAFPIIAVASVFYFDSQLAGRSQGSLSVGDFLAFLAAFIQFLTASLLLSKGIIGSIGVVPLYERAQPIFQTLPEASSVKSSPGELIGAIEISRVNFRYFSDSPLVLSDVSVTIPPGQMVALVGPSGSGKSTLVRLLLGFEVPDSGAIYYDGRDLAGLDIQDVRRQVGVVLQNGRLFPGDIYHNIVGSAALTIKDAWDAATVSGLADDIRRMSMGMYTVISEGGGGLSGGQRQRLLIARAIVTRPRIIIFDEATSALDNETQQVVRRSLDDLRATRVVVAHRLSTITNADRIFVMCGGKVVQSGNFYELKGQRGLFSDLIRRQLT